MTAHFTRRLSKVVGLVVLWAATVSLQGCDDSSEGDPDVVVTTTTEETTEEKDIIYDVYWPGWELPAEGGDFVFIKELPTDRTYHATKFEWSPSTNPNWWMSMMFTISDAAVATLKAKFDVNKPMTNEAFMIAMNAGGYMLFQQGGKDFTLDPDWGFLVGKDTARKHVLVRWSTKPNKNGANQTDTDQAGYRIHLTTKLRNVNVGEAKFAIIGGGGNITLEIPPGETDWNHIVQCTKEGTNKVFRGDGVKVLKVKPIANYGQRFRITEAQGGGTFSEANADEYKYCSLPHPGNLLLEDGDFQEIFSLNLSKRMETINDAEWFDVDQPFTLKNGNSYRAEAYYNTTGLNESLITGESGYDIHFYYEEKPNNNEPFPGYCMDRGPWFMRTHNINEATANEMMKIWRQNPFHGSNSSVYGCPTS